MKYIKTLKQYKESVDFEPEFDELEDELDVDFQEEEPTTLEEEPLGEEPFVGEEPLEPLDLEHGDHIIGNVADTEVEPDIDGDGVVDVVPSEEADEYTDFADWEEPEDIDPDFVEGDPLATSDLDVEELPGDIGVPDVELQEEPLDTDLGGELDELGDSTLDDSMCDFCDEQPKAHGGLCDACYNELED